MKLPNFVPIFCIGFTFLVIASQTHAEDRGERWRRIYPKYDWKLERPGVHTWRVRLQPGGTAVIFRFDGGTTTRGKWTETGWGSIQLEDPDDTSLANVTMSFYGPGDGPTGLTWWDSKSGSAGTGSRTDPAPFTPPVASEATPTPGVPMIAVFAEQLSAAMGWATLPLSNTVPPQIRDMIAEFRSGLREEGVKTPQASAQAYADAELICRTLLYVLDDRQNTLDQNKQNAGGKLTESWMTTWTNKCARYRAALRTNIEQFGAAVRQSEKPKVPVPTGMVAAITLPPVPGAAAAPTYELKPDPNNPLNRGAYDRHNIWSPWWGPYRYYR